MLLVNVKLLVGIRALHFKVPNFIGLINLECHRQDEVGNIGILVLWRVCEKLM